MKDEDIRREFENRKRNTTKDDLKKTLEHEEEIKAKSRKGALAKFWEDIQLMFNLLRDYWNGDYREVSWERLQVLWLLYYIFFHP